MQPAVTNSYANQILAEVKKMFPSSTITPSGYPSYIPPGSTQPTGVVQVTTPLTSTPSSTTVATSGASTPTASPLATPSSTQTSELSNGQWLNMTQSTLPDTGSSVQDYINSLQSNGMKVVGATPTSATTTTSAGASAPLVTVTHQNLGMEPLMYSQLSCGCLKNALARAGSGGGLGLAGAGRVASVAGGIAMMYPYSVGPGALNRMSAPGDQASVNPVGALKQNYSKSGKKIIYPGSGKKKGKRHGKKKHHGKKH